MDTNVLYGLIGAFITATITGIAIWSRLRATNKQRVEAIYERLLGELSNIVRVMGNWDGNPARLPDVKKRVISRMLHMHLDSLVEAIALEGSSGWRKFRYKLGFGKHCYEELGGEWFLEKHRYRRFEYWYSVTLMLYNGILGASAYVEEVFHLKKDDPHKNIDGSNCLKQYFRKRLKSERGKQMDEKVKVAGVQMEPKIKEKEKNLDRCLELIERTAKKGARLIVFPECALTGYCFDSREEALPLAEPIPGSSTKKLLTTCVELNVYVVIGLLESDGDKCYNTAVLLGPDGLVGKQRKLHLPYLGVDRFLDPGNLPLTTYDTDVGRIGMGICYDMMFPEHSRALALLGADILVFPANWPETGNVYPDYIIPTRATENRVFCVGVNRIGKERGTTFAGRSKIVYWFGQSLAEGKENEQDIIYANIKPAEARKKRWVIEPKKHEVDFINDRRPEFYGHVCEVSSKLK